MTRESTSFHTDSSARDVQPDHVGLLCLRRARLGGESLVSSAVAVHEALQRMAPELLEQLYRDYARDLVTPGSERCVERIRSNRFPIYRRAASRAGLDFRYMRYWIERAHALIGEALPAVALRAFDALDGLLSSERFAWSFHLERGEMLWVDNRTIAHSRHAFTDDPSAPRRMVRMWVAERTDTIS